MNAVYQHEDGTRCVWDGTAWYIPYDVGGEGPTCEKAHHVNSAVSDAPETNVFIDDESGAGLILAERKRQVEVKGYDAKHDSRHNVRDFVQAGGAYLGLARWPWSLETFKYRNGDGFYVKRNLVKAGAMIAAAIDRIIEVDKR